MKLIIVESPTKAKTIINYAGKDFKVISSKGHIIDLPEKELGIDIDNDFKPVFIPIKSKKTVIATIKKESLKADKIYIATDPDREGEAIAYFINSVIDKNRNPDIKRVLFYEITKKGIKNGLDNPREINENLVNSQFSRRILDRIVGYKVSPFLWKSIRTGLSAGRVQSVALRIICEKEDLIDKFISKKFFKIKGHFEKDKTDFFAELIKFDGIKTTDLDIGDKIKIKKDLEGSNYIISDFKTRNKNQSPPPPFITSTIQQTAANVYNFSAKKTMRIAQQLYEGLEINGKLTGLITYMRTDSTRMADEAIESIRDYIISNSDRKYLYSKPRIYKSGKNAQEGHEAIRPSDINLIPDGIQDFLSMDQFKIYSLIWKRSIACQMNDAVFSVTTADITAKKHLFRATGNTMIFDGFLSIYPYSKTANLKNEVPNMSIDEKMPLKKLDISEEKTKPPARYTDATLIRTLEKEGIGRPSTYAAIIDVLLRRNYMEKEQRKFIPTELGRIVNKVLTDYFKEIFNVKFTAQMEEQLDLIEDSKTNYQEVLRDFYNDFKVRLDNAMNDTKQIKKNLEKETDIKCDKCGSPMIIKWGRFGKFLACSNYPKCKSTKPLDEEKLEGEECPECGKELIIKRGRFGRFIACSNYPTCKFTKPITTGIKCPECGEGELAEKQTSKRRLFWGCSNYPKCKFATWQRPVKKECPECKNPFMEMRKDTLYCPKCKHTEPKEK